MWLEPRTIGEVGGLGATKHVAGHDGESEFIRGSRGQRHSLRWTRHISIRITKSLLQGWSTAASLHKLLWS